MCSEYGVYKMNRCNHWCVNGCGKKVFIVDAGSRDYAKKWQCVICNDYFSTNDLIKAGCINLRNK